MSDFSIQRVSATIASAVATATAVTPTNFSEIQDVAKAFFMPAVWPMTTAGWGKTTSTVNNSLLNTDATAQITDTDTITFNDGDATIARTTACAQYLLEYIGPAGGSNEIAPLGTGTSTEFTMTLANGSSTVDSAQIVGVTAGTFAKCVPLVTSYGSANTNNYNSHLFSVDLVDSGSGVYVVRVTRGSTNGNQTIRGRVLWFKGGNWAVQRVAHSFTAGNTNEDETITAVDTARTFVLTSTNQNSTAQPAQATCYAYVSGTTTLRHRLHSKAAGTISMVSYVISNPLLSVTRYGTPDGTAELTGAGSGTQTHNVTITAVPDLTQAMVIGQAGSLSTATTAAPCLYTAFNISTTTNVQILKSEGLGDLEYVLYVLDFSNVVSTKIETVSTITEGSSFTITGRFSAAGVPTVTLGADSVTVTANDATSITCDGAIGIKKYGEANTLTVVDAAGGTDSLEGVTVAPPATMEYTNLAPPLIQGANRVTATPVDLVGTEQLRIRNVTGTGMDLTDVEVFSNAAFSASEDVVSFEVSANDGTGWGTWGTQTLQEPIAPPAIVNLDNPVVVTLIQNAASQVNVGLYVTGWASVAVQTGTLPVGLSHSTGIVTGSVATLGSTTVTFRYTNTSGFVDKVVRFDVIPPALNGRGKLSLRNRMLIRL